MIGNLTCPQAPTIDYYQLGKVRLITTNTLRQVRKDATETNCWTLFFSFYLLWPKLKGGQRAGTSDFETGHKAVQIWGRSDQGEEKRKQKIFSSTSPLFPRVSFHLCISKTLVFPKTIPGDFHLTLLDISQMLSYFGMIFRPYPTDKICHKNWLYKYELSFPYKYYPTLVRYNSLAAIRADIQNSPLNI